MHPTPSISTFESKHSAFPGHEKLLRSFSSANQQLAEPGSKMLTGTPKASSYGTHRADGFTKVHDTLQSVHADGPELPEGTTEQGTGRPHVRWSRRAAGDRPSVPPHRPRSQDTGTWHPQHRQRDRGTPAQAAGCWCRGVSEAGQAPKTGRIKTFC